MNKKTIFDKYVDKIEKGTSPEAMEMKKIMLKMIKGEYAWAKMHQDENIIFRDKVDILGYILLDTV